MINHRNVGPLREIVDWAPHFTVFGHGAAILACGHEKIAKRGSRSKRTRCYGCESGTPATHPHDCIGKWPERHLDWCVLCRAVGPEEAA